MQKHKKIAVMTSYYINNYGSILQALATKEYLYRMGLDVVFINYVRDNVRNRKVVNPNWETNIIRKTIYRLYKYVDGRSKERVFSGYINKHLALTSPFNTKEDLYNSEIDADIFCVGSDQMWNSEYNGGVIEENFLGFAPKGKKKISFSTSMGMTAYNETEVERMKELLDDFSFISVRENSAVEILSTAGLSNVYQMLDPTLLITDKQWRNIIKIEQMYKNYVLIYQLNDNPDMQEFARNIAREHNLSVIQITYYMSQHWRDIKSIYDPSIEEFVSLIVNADYVVTDSFHGTAFSINLNKEIFAFSPEKYSDRINSILSITGLENRLVQDIDQYAMPNPIDYEKIEGILKKCRQKAELLVKEGLK